MALPWEAFEDDALNFTSRQLWNNELIWKEIKSYLNSDDLFSLASTNEYFHLKLTKGLTDYVTLVIKDEDDFKLKTQSKLHYSNASILVIRNIGTLSEDTIIPGLVKVLSNSRKLTHLMFETHEFFQEKYSQLFKNKFVRYRFSQLKKLEIGHLRKVQINDDNNFNLNIVKELTTFNLFKGTEIVPTYNTFPYIDMQLESFYYQEADSSVPTSFFQPELILCTSMCSLRSLTLSINVDGFKKLQKLRFLRLEKLELTISLPLPIEALESLRPALLNENENLPDNRYAIVNENENLGGGNRFNNERGIENEQMVVDAGNVDEGSGSDPEDDNNSDSDENDSDEESDEEELITPLIIEYIIPFLRNHIHTLQSVKMSLLHGCSLKVIYDIFRQSKKIELFSFVCVGNKDDFLEGIDWSLLRNLSTLKGFKLKFEYENQKMYCYSDQEYCSSNEEDSDSEDENNGAQDQAQEIEEIDSPKFNYWNWILKYLPGSMECLSLCQFEYLGNPNEISSVVISSVGKFANLRILGMEKCPDFFNDDTLQFICKTLTKLRKLKGEFHKVTDFGISGLKEDGEDSGVSLRNLKGLQKLVIYSGSGSSLDNKLCFTWAGLLRSVAFLEMTRLKIIGSLKDVHMDGRKADSKDGHNYLKLIQQNPSLTEIGLSFYTPINWFREQVSKLNPRITTIHLNALL